MDDRRVGRLFREIRIRHGWRQTDVARLAGVSQGTVSQIELGRLERVSLPALRAVASVLDCRVTTDVWWRAGQQDRLLDRAHAALVEYMARYLTDLGWLVRTEVGFNQFGDRGAADLVGWHERRQALAIAEMKSRFEDLQALGSSFDRKRRVLPDQLERELGWTAREVGGLLVAVGTRANRTIVREHRVSLSGQWPDDTRAATAWLAGRPRPGNRTTPRGHGTQRPFGAVLFVAPDVLPDRARPAERVRPR